MTLKSTVRLSLSFRYDLIAFLIVSVVTPIVEAAVVRGDVDYQYFRDFAENKGKFAVGTRNIIIVNQEGKEVGVMMKDIPMPDLRTANQGSGIATLISPQYITSVAHNGGYPSVSFGGEDINPDSHHYTYLLVDRNNYPEKTKSTDLHKDYHVPRLSKLVTEVAPVAVSDAEQTQAVYADMSRFPIYVRVGSGTQYIRYSDNNDDLKQVSEAYNYLIGGAAMPINSTKAGNIDSSAYKSLFNDKYGPMATYGRGGDSGSGLYAFDTLKNQWVLVGVLNFDSGDNINKNIWTLPRLDFIKEKEDEDIAGTIENKALGDVWTWNAVSNASNISHNDQSLSVALKNDNSDVNVALNAGKTVNFSGIDGGVLLLKNNINQGAGALYFNSNFTVKSESNYTWLGAGVSVAEGKKVTWQVNNPQGDRLSKIGAGTLLVQGKGKNLGDISVGDGIVILDQQADEQGQKQAFNELGITSGRPTVILQSADQIDPNKLYFGFRGGRLDLNGNNLTFKRIQHSDDGAMIVNHNVQQVAEVTLTGSSYTESDLKWGSWKQSGADIYEYSHRNRKDYFILKGSASGYYPIDQTSDGNWEYIGSDKQTALNTVLQRKNEKELLTAFSGYLGENATDKNNGGLNITYQPNVSGSLLLLSGGANLNGDLTVSVGELFLAGSQTPHAYDFLANKEVIYEDDWKNRDYLANNISVNNKGILTVGRNVSYLNANINGTDDTVLNIGYQIGQKVCLRSDYTGKVSCDTPTYDEKTLNTIPRTQFIGNVTLFQQSRLHLGKTDFTGAIQGSETSRTTLSNDTHWILTKDSTVGHLDLVQGSQITLSQENNLFNTLTINGDLSGSGQFYYRSRFSDLGNDKVFVNGQASGTHLLVVDDIGSEPQRSKERLTLMTVTSPAENLSVALSNDYADIGTYRYHLIQEGNAFRLYNPIVEKEIEEEERNAAEEQARREAEAKRLEEERKAAEEQARREAEAKRLEEERKAAEEQARREAEAKRLEEERKAAEEQARREAEAKRLEEERKAAEEQARREAEAKRLEEERKTKEEHQKAELAGFKQAELISRVSNTALSELSAQVNEILQTDQQLNRRILQEGATQTQVWTNVDIQNADYQSDNYRAYKQHSTYTELGTQSAMNDQGMSLGAVVSQASTNVDYDNSSGKMTYSQATVYAKMQNEQGVFGAIDLGYGSSNNHITLDSETVNIKRKVLSFGAALGKKWSLGYMDLKTIVGLRYHRLSATDYVLKERMIQTDSLNLINYHTGAELSKAWLWNTLTIIPNMAVYYFDASHKTFNTAVVVNNNALQQQFNRGWQYQVGLDLNMGAWSFGAKFVYENGEEYSYRRQLGLKVGYRF